MKRYNSQITIVGCFILGAANLSSCTKKESSTPNTNDLTTSSNASVAAMGPNFIPIRTCPKLMTDLSTNTDIAKLAQSSIEFQLEITKINPRELSDIVYRRNSATSPWYKTKETGKAKPTRWDFDLELGQPTTTTGTTEYKNAKISIKLNPTGGHKFRFVEDDYVIRAGNESGYTSFCGVEVKNNVASFTAIYNPKSVVENPSFNIGVIVEDKIDPKYEMPIYLDPEVKNAG